MRLLPTVAVALIVLALLAEACGGAAISEISDEAPDASADSLFDAPAEPGEAASSDPSAALPDTDAPVLDQSAEPEGPDAENLDQSSELAVWDGSDAEDDTLPADAGQGCIASIAAGYSRACALRTDRTVWCWGDNRSGELGDGTHTGQWCTNAVCKPTPVQVIGLEQNIVRIAAGGAATCALTQAGAVWCWGMTHMLGDEELVAQDCWKYSYGNPPNTNTVCTQCTPYPVLFKGFESNVEQLSMGWLSACAVKSDGTLWCWGDNATGVLGDGTLGDKTCPSDHPNCDRLPVQVASLSDVAQATVGQLHACARSNQGAVSCWGDNFWGQLGRGSFSGMTCGSDTCEPLPAPVSAPGETALEVSSGALHTCERKADGTVWCWGSNEPGLLGDGTTEGEPCGYGGLGKCRAMAVQTQLLTDATSISTGGHHSCAIRADKTLWCWGNNALGQLGTGAIGATEPWPVQVAALGPHVVSVSAGVGFTCAVTDNGRAWCWGLNNRGELGNGTINGGQPCGTNGASGCEPFPVLVALECP